MENQTNAASGLYMYATSHNQINQNFAISGVTTNGYDAAGNMVFDGRAAYLYDGDGHVCAVKTSPISGGVMMTQYLYDASGTRVAKGTISTWSCDATTNGFVMTNQYLRGPSGEQMTELVANGSTMAWEHTNISAGGTLFATYENDNSGPHFRFSDWLGTMRAQTNYAGVLEQTCASLPFGDGPPCASATEQFYTGKERDAESGLDHFLFRNYASTMGRWMSPDPGGMAVVDLSHPQTLNRYAYVNNNPLSFVDPLGLDCAYLNDAGNGLESFDQNSSSGECGKSGGYWVDGGLKDYQIDADRGTVNLVGTTDGQNSTYASYQDTNVFVTEWHNTWLNPFNHIGISLQGQWPVGQNPQSDSAFQLGLLENAGSGNGLGALQVSVPGQIQPENPTGTLMKFSIIPVTGMQANMIQSAINQGTQNPPNYSVLGGLDCSTWVQQVLGSAGVNTGPGQPFPNDLMKQLGSLYPTFPGHP